MLVNFFKKGIYLTFDKGKIEKSLFKGLNMKNSDDANLKQDILEAMEAFKNSKTAGYTKRCGNNKEADEEEEDSHEQEGIIEEDEEQKKDLRKKAKQEQGVKLTYLQMTENVCYRYAKWDKEHFLKNRALSYLFQKSFPYLKA